MLLPAGRAPGPRLGAGRPRLDDRLPGQLGGRGRHDSTRRRPACCSCPWHGYQPFPFTQDRTVATPAGAFFPGPVLSSSAVEVGPLRSDSTSQQQAAMDELVAAGGGPDFAGSLVNLGVTHVGLSRGAEDDRYAWVARAAGADPVLDDPVVHPLPRRRSRCRAWTGSSLRARPSSPCGPARPARSSSRSSTRRAGSWTGARGRPTPEGTIAFEVGADEAQIVYRPWSRIKVGHHREPRRPPRDPRRRARRASCRPAPSAPRRAGESRCLAASACSS